MTAMSSACTPAEMRERTCARTRRASWGLDLESVRRDDLVGGFPSAVVVVVLLSEESFSGKSPPWVS